MTNYEKIKAMSVEEMADWINRTATDCDSCPEIKYCIPNHGTCQATIQDFLESEVEEDG